MYSKVDRAKVRKFIKSVLEKDFKMDDERLAVVLNEAGFKRPDGKAFDRSAANYQRRMCGTKYRRRKLYKSPGKAKPRGERKAGSDLEPMFELILMANLPDAKKVSMLKSLKGL